MNDNEQELLGFIEERLRRLSNDGDILYHAGKIQAKLKAMGYVKWDREKVEEVIAKKFAELMPDRFLLAGQAVHSLNGKQLADQLKEILIGSMK